MGQRLIEAAEEAITEVFNDTSVSPGETRQILNDLVDFIEEMRSTLAG